MRFSLESILVEQDTLALRLDEFKLDSCIRYLSGEKGDQTDSDRLVVLARSRGPRGVDANFSESGLARSTAPAREADWRSAEATRKYAAGTLGRYFSLPRPLTKTV